MSTGLTVIRFPKCLFESETSQK